MMRSLLISLLSSLFALHIIADDWPQWRGPNRDGVSAESGWTTQWPQEGPRQLWKTSVGVGFASVAISQGRLFTLGNAAETDTVFCLDANSGAAIWKHSYPCNSMTTVSLETGPAATPTVDGERVYTLSREGHLFCLATDTGKIIWQKNLAKDFGAQPPPFGMGGSPLVADDLLLLNVGRAGLALDKLTGKIVWQSELTDAGYASPVRCGTLLRRAIFFTRHEVVCVRNSDGRVFWRLPWRTEENNNCADPIVVGDKVFVSSGYDHGGALLQMRDNKASVLWENKNLRNHFSSSVHWQGALFGFDGNTHQLRDCRLKCLDLAKGKVQWTADEFRLGSLIVADGKLVILSDKGELVVAEASPQAFKPIARAQVLGGKCWTAPALANGRLYCRNAKGDLVCLDLSAK